MTLEARAVPGLRIRVRVEKFGRLGIYGPTVGKKRGDARPAWHTPVAWKVVS